MYLSFSLKECYLWKKNKDITIDTTFPWKRFLNQEFLEYEKIRLNKLFGWYKLFIESDKNKNLEEVSFSIKCQNCNKKHSKKG